MILEYFDSQLAMLFNIKNGYYTQLNDEDVWAIWNSIPSDNEDTSNDAGLDSDEDESLTQRITEVIEELLTISLLPPAYLDPLETKIDLVAETVPKQPMIAEDYIIYPILSKT
ncbi:hypothetical protein FQA39_LY17830 [Lamprigera yunnana]|nr:hypothetical protein FQA39_LY17830 [Lamprigera yunnana]